MVIGETTYGGYYKNSAEPGSRKHVKDLKPERVKPGLVVRLPVLRKKMGVAIAKDEEVFREQHPLLDH